MNKNISSLTILTDVKYPFLLVPDIYIQFLNQIKYLLMMIWESLRKT